MQLAADIDLRPTVEPFALADANEALERLRLGSLRGAAVLVTPHAATHTAAG
jgi:D-arabinose 1-dehydrogenase-like Zn-dependent alcohol dehydrogenase